MLVLGRATSKRSQEIIIIAQGRTGKIDVVDLRDNISVRALSPARRG